MKVFFGIKVFVDGLVCWGLSYVNESMVIGEFVFVLKEVNIIVIGGIMNLYGVLYI